MKTENDLKKGKMQHKKHMKVDMKCNYFFKTKKH